MSTSATTATHPPSGVAGIPAPQARIAVRVFPFLRWFEGYSLPRLRADALAGLTVALVLIPQSMAYAKLAGLPAYYGLYAAFLPPMVAAMFGSSHQLSTGPVAVVSLMTAAALEPLATAGGSTFIAYAVALSLMVGLFQFCLGFFRLGVVVNFLSHPVVNGFTNAAALIIATSQLPSLLGVSVDGAEHHYETVYRTVRAALHFCHWPSLALAALSIGVMVALRKINRKIPDVLVAVVLTTLISWAVGFEKNRSVALSDIHDPAYVQTVQSFNATLVDIAATADKKVALSTALQQAQSAAPADPVGLMNLRHELALLELQLAQLKDNAASLRAQLRKGLFQAATVDGRTQLYLEGAVPAGAVVESGTWRVNVGTQKLDLAKLSAVGGGAVVGAIPKGLRFGLPTQDREGRSVDILQLASRLLSAAVVISLLGFMEAISIAKAMAAKTGQRLDPNQELIGQGLANMIGSFAQAYPVSGSFSRSAVNMQGGAVTGLSSVFASAVVLATLYLFTPLLYHLPQSVLASIIIMAVVGLLNVRGFAHAWHAQKFDGAISVISFAATLVFAPHLDKGIMIGVALSVGLYLLRNMKPQIALLSKHPDGTYRNAERFDLPLCRHIAVVRFNGSLFFANVNYLEERILEVISSMRELKHVVIVGNGMNELDASGEEMLSLIVSRLRASGYEVSISGLNDSVLDVMRRTRLYERLGEDHLFRSVALAIDTIHAEAHRGSDERQCPLLYAPFRPLPVAAELARSMELMDQRKAPEPSAGK